MWDGADRLARPHSLVWASGVRVGGGGAFVSADKYHALRSARTHTHTHAQIKDCAGTGSPVRNLERKRCGHAFWDGRLVESPEQWARIRCVDLAVVQNVFVDF